MKIETLQDKVEEIKLLMQFAVPQESKIEAAALVEKHGGDAIALNIFHSFYSYLPEAQDDAVNIIRTLDTKNGVYLVAVSSRLDNYIYIATVEKAEFLGPVSEGIWDEEVLDFFGFADREATLKKFAQLENFPVYVPLSINTGVCPVCAVSDGELHIFGCSLEVCPWCGGSLVQCQCRFNRLGIDNLQDETQLEELLEKAEQKGRIPFNATNDRPEYPITPDDLLEED